MTGGAFLACILLTLAALFAGFATFLIFHGRRRPAEGFGSILLSLGAAAFFFYQGLVALVGPLAS